MPPLSRRDAASPAIPGSPVVAPPPSTSSTPRAGAVSPRPRSAAWLRRFRPSHRRLGASIDILNLLDVLHPGTTLPHRRRTRSRAPEPSMSSIPSRRANLQSLCCQLIVEQGELKLRVRTLESGRAFQRVVDVQKTIGYGIPAGSLVNIATILYFNSIWTPATIAYSLCAFVGLQVLVGLIKVKKLDRQEKLITGTA